MNTVTSLAHDKVYWLLIITNILGFVGGIIYKETENGWVKLVVVLVNGITIGWFILPRLVYKEIK